MLILNEEEEINSKNKTNNNNLNEEEEKEVNYCAFSNFKNYLHSNPLILSSTDFSNNELKDNLVFKVPSPPPEQL